jgi:hypothetical protein
MANASRPFDKLRVTRLGPPNLRSMKHLAAVLVLAFIAALPVAAPAKTTTAGASSTLSATPPTCPANDPVVWVNTKSKIYWAQGTKYYGKTKQGGYACTSQAVAYGARAAKASSMSGSSMSGGSMNAPTPTASAMGKPHKHKSSGMSGMPMATPTP